MTRDEFAIKLIEDHGAAWKKGEAKEIVKIVFEALAAEIGDGKKIFINGFGTFLVVTRPARNGVNPKTQEKIRIAEKNVIKFQPARSLVQMIS